MSLSDKTPVTMQELLVSSLAQTDALAKLLIEKGHHHAAGVSCEHFRTASDISGDAKADITLTQITDIEYPRDWGIGCAFHSSFRPNSHRPAIIVR